jgi:UDPglucose--hexose-1-phosphate uridylyltransferase
LVPLKRVIPTGSHRRYNPLLDEWVLCAPHRLERPWQGAVETSAPTERPPYDPTCYLCPGNARANGATNPRYTGTFAFDNDFPALVQSAEGRPLDEGLFRAEPEAGICRVVSFSPRHDLSLARMPDAEIRRVIDTWATESAAIAARPGISHVQVFENKGEMMGCSNPHPHSQIWATAHVPTLPARKAAAFAAYAEAHDDDLLGDYLTAERATGERVVFADEAWTAVVPFWAVWPFETMLIPHRRVPDLESLTSAERESLARSLRRLTARYDRLFDTEFPYSMGVAQAPIDDKARESWRLHLAFTPPLLRSATIRKFFTGYELTAEAQRDLTAEAAAARLREMHD